MVTAAKTASQIGMHMGVAAILEPICNVILLPFHDRLWEKIRSRVETQPDALALDRTIEVTRPV